MPMEGSELIIRQSTISTWMRCPLMYRFQEEGRPREQSSALSFGTVIHEAVLVMETAETDNLVTGINHFNQMWDNLSDYDLEYSFLIPRNSHDGYQELGHRILRDWWALIMWESDIVLAREYNFTVPFGTHELTGTIDKLALRPRKGGGYNILVSDYKTSAKQPTRDYLAHNLQFTAYSYATTQEEFWVNLPDGDRLYAEHTDSDRDNEWVQLRGPRRVPAGLRTEMHYNRLRYAIDQIEMSAALGIFVPNISGDTCQFCEYRQICGLPSLDEELAA